MSKTYAEKLRRALVLTGCLLAAGAALADDDFPRVETSPAFMYIHNTPFAGGPNGINCAGAGGTFAVNVTSALGLAADLGFCKVFGTNVNALNNGTVKGSEQTFLFGPRFTFRSKSPIRPFVEVSGGIVRASLKCANGNLGNLCASVTQLPTTLPAGVLAGVNVNPFATSLSTNAPAFSIGGGLDIKASKKISIRLFQAEYLYTAFGNDCRFAFCNTGTNNSQNSFRLKSGIVMAWGGGQ